MDNQDFKRKKALFEGLSLFAILILVLVIVLVSVNTKAPMFFVLLGFSPTLITIIAGIIVFEESRRHRIVIWSLVFILPALFFVIVTSQEILSSNLDAATLVSINVVISVLYLAVFYLLTKLFFKSTHIQKHEPKVVVQKQQPQTLKEYIASIEDKSKAINFVIGRVYSKYHGGSKELREKIGIDKAWYNEFSEILQDENTQEMQKVEHVRKKDELVSLLYVVNKIQERLHQLKKSEATVFGQKHMHLKNLDRHESGNESILHVMIKNDKDPIESYHKGAMEFCEGLKTKLESLIQKS